METSSRLLQDADIPAIWRTDLFAVGCLSCGVAHLLPGDWNWSRCPSCLADSLEPQPARLRPEPPELVLLFAPSLTPSHLSVRLAEWLRGAWLRPQDLRVEHLLSRLARIYWPMWLIDGEVLGTWGAQMGFDYQVESTQERFSQAHGWTSQSLIETHVRWESRIGRLKRTYHNLAVTALDGQEEEALTARLGHYELERAVAYTPAAIAGAAVRIPSLLPEEAWPLGRIAFDRSAAVDCQQAADAQHCDEFTLSADYDHLNWSQLLLPFYLTYYRDDQGRLFPVWINGQSGRVSGLRRASLRKGWRVAGAIALVAAFGFLVGVILTLIKLAGIGALLMTTSFFLLILAALPLLWVWHFNQHSFDN